MHIQIPYTPRPLQAKLHEDLDNHRFAVLNCHRRFGKTILVILHLIRKALTNDKKNPRYYLIGPTFDGTTETGLGELVSQEAIETYLDSYTQDWTQPSPTDPNVEVPFNQAEAAAFIWSLKT